MLLFLHNLISSHNLLILILGCASADVSADKSAGKQSVMCANLGFLGHLWIPHPSLPSPPKKSICPPPICSGSSTQFASTSELEKVTMPIDGSANSLNILLTALTDGILDMVGTESILVMFFGR